MYTHHAILFTYTSTDNNNDVMPVHALSKNILFICVTVLIFVMFFSIPAGYIILLPSLTDFTV